MAFVIITIAAIFFCGSIILMLALGYGEIEKERNRLQQAERTRPVDLELRDFTRELIDGEQSFAFGERKRYEKVNRCVFMVFPKSFPPNGT